MSKKIFWNPRIERMPRKELKELQFRRLKQEVKFVYDNTPFYHKRYDEAGVKPDDLKTMDDFTKFPTYLKDDIRDFRNQTNDIYGGLLSVPREKLYHVTHTTGTTGLPTFYGHTFNDWSYCVEQLTRQMYRTSEGELHSGLIGYAVGIAWHGYQAQVAQAADKLGSKLLLDSAVESFMNPKRIARLILNSGIGKLFYTLGAPIPALLGLTTELKKQGITRIRDVFPNLKYISTGLGDVVTLPFRSWVEREFELPKEKIYDLGGTADLLWYYANCKEWVGNHYEEDLFLIETLDVENNEPVGPGEKGEVHGTSLFWEATPAVRYDIEDVAIKYNDECNCGKTHERVKFLGRAKFLINVKGKKIFPSEIEEIFGKYPETLEAKFSMVRYEKEPLEILKIRAVYDKSKTKDPDELKKNLERDVEKSFNIPAEIEWVDFSELPIVFHKINRIIDLTSKS